VRLVNETNAVAAIQVVDFVEPERRAAVVVKKTYALAQDGTLRREDEQLPLVPDHLETPFGLFHGELFFRKRGVDLCVLGTGRFDSPVTRAKLRIEAGSWAHELRLVGDRVWTQDASGNLVPSAPTPFVEMPIAYARAFGGSTDVGGASVPWPDNPLGRGYYETAEQALGQPLPNIEAIDAPAPAWNSRPPVAGWAPYPMYWGLRASRAVKVDPDSGEILDITPELFNHAHPDLILPALDAGTRVRVLGLRPQTLGFFLPRERPRVEIHVGDRVSEALGDIDGVFLWSDAARLVVTWRARFRYPVHTEEVRGAVLSFLE
jgi:hypothetical protein